MHACRPIPLLLPRRRSASVECSGAVAHLLGIEHLRCPASKSLRQLTQGQLAQTVGREPQQSAGAAFHHQLTVITEAASHQFADHRQGAAAAFAFLHQAAAGGASQGGAGTLQALGQGRVTVAGPLHAGAGQACFQLRSQQL